MNRQLIRTDPENFPSQFHPLLTGAPVYDSHCSPEARVWFVDRDNGYYLKSAPAGSLKTEAEMTRFFHGKGLGPQVLAYASEGRDWLLSTRVPGEDCTHRMYLEGPIRLCDTIAERLRHLHSQDPTGCPIPDRTGSYLATARTNYLQKKYDATLFPDNWGYSSPEEAWAVASSNAHLLKTDTLLHGDYCLPNIMLDNWRFSGFIDVGNGGVGDRHIDLFWGIWSLGFNLKTDQYRDRFLDAYGREDIEPEFLRIIAAFEVFG